MKDLFASLYEFFKPLYGSDLADHLFGLNPNNNGNYDARSLYVVVGVTCLLLSAAFVVGFYKLLDSPKFSRWFHWTIVLGVNWAINLLFGWWMPYKDLEKGNVAASLKDVIQSGNLWGFGFANSVWAIIFFILLSMIVRPFSRNCSTTPFATKFL
jgi:hypothetical protein